MAINDIKNVKAGAAVDLKDNRLWSKLWSKEGNFGYSRKNVSLLKLRDVMQIQLDIGFDQLVSLVKNLSPKQWNRLKKEVEKKDVVSKGQQDMEAFLLSAPTLNEEQLNAIQKARESINQWRKK